jgi:hypothetical protein
MHFIESQAEARATFLQAVEDLAPEVLVDLKDSVYPIWEAKKSENRSDPRWRGALEDWAKRWNLIDPWCLEWAERSLPWLNDPEGPRWSPNWYLWIKNSGPAEPFIHLFPPIKIEEEPWRPDERSWKAYKDEVVGQFNKAVKRQKSILLGFKPNDIAVEDESQLPTDSGQRKQYEEGLRLGLLETYHKRVLGRASEMKLPQSRQIQRFYWLAGYQVKAWSVANIVRSSRKRWVQKRSLEKQRTTAAEREKRETSTRRTIDTAIAQLSKKIGLTRREDSKSNFSISAREIEKELISALRKASPRARLTSYYKYAVPQRGFFR